MILLDIFTNKTYTLHSAINTLIKDYYNKEIDDCIVVTAIIYLHRYYKSGDTPDSKKRLNDIIKTCMYLSVKFVMDISISSTTILENFIINKLNWDLFVSEEQYLKYSQILYSSENNLRIN